MVSKVYIYCLKFWIPYWTLSRFMHATVNGPIFFIRHSNSFWVIDFFMVWSLDFEWRWELIFFVGHTRIPLPYLFWTSSRSSNSYSSSVDPARHRRRICRVRYILRIFQSSDRSLIEVQSATDLERFSEPLPSFFVSQVLRAYTDGLLSKSLFEERPLCGSTRVDFHASTTSVPSSNSLLVFFLYTCYTNSTLLLCSKHSGPMTKPLYDTLHVVDVFRRHE